MNFTYKLSNGICSKLSKQQLKSTYKKLDLIILDADGTVAPNITVGLANEIFNQLLLETLTDRNINERNKVILEPRNNIKQLFREIRGSKLSIKRGRAKYFLLAKLFISGLRLYNRRLTSQFAAQLKHNKASHENLIRLVVQTLTGKKMQLLVEKATGNSSIEDYLYTKKQVEQSMYSGIIDFIKHLKKQNKKVKIVMISESFAVKGKLNNKNLGLLEHYRRILPLNDLISNEFCCSSDGCIKSVRINVQRAADKEAFAKKLISRYNAKNVAVIANDWEDFLLCILPETKLAILRNPPRSMRKYAHIVVKEGYEGLYQ